MEQNKQTQDDVEKVRKYLEEKLKYAQHRGIEEIFGGHQIPYGSTYGPIYGTDPNLRLYIIIEMLVVIGGLGCNLEKMVESLSQKVAEQEKILGDTRDSFRKFLEKEK